MPDVRDSDELADLLQTLIVLPVEGISETASQHGICFKRSQWCEFYAQLVLANRATTARVNGVSYWVAAERMLSFKRIFPGAEIEHQLPTIEKSEKTPEAALLIMLRGWMSVVGPTTAAALSARLGLDLGDVCKSLMALESDGVVLRGKFESQEKPVADELIEWCDRRLLSRIHRLTIGTLRKQIEPVTPAQFMRWLLLWQHVTPSAQLAGERGTLEILKQLQGFEIPANSWERDVLSKRLTRYDSLNLDNLCMRGQVGWGRLSPHPATLAENNDGEQQKTRRIIPTSVAPITFFVRGESDWMMPIQPITEADETRFLSHCATQVRHYLSARGASFFADIVRGVNQLKSEVETALWELVAAGIVTADGFDNLRALIDPKRRSGLGTARYAMPRHSSGRWSLLYVDEVEKDKVVESACRMLLCRYGVVFRDLLVRETSLPRWRDLLDAFRRLEDRAEVRGGRFISGFIGEQFALPEASDSLRAIRKREQTGELTAISAADPLNLVGIILAGEKIPANSGRTITYRDGVPLEELS